MDLPIRTIALIALGVMVVVLIFVSFESFFTEVTTDFISELDFSPDP